MGPGPSRPVEHVKDSDAQGFYFAVSEGLATFKTCQALRIDMIQNHSALRDHFVRWYMLWAYRRLIDHGSQGVTNNMPHVA